MIPSKIDIKELYTCRLLVFVETEPLSNKYQQVYLTPKQLLSISNTIADAAKFIKQDGDIEVLDIATSEDVYVLPDLKMIHEEKRS